MLKIIILFCEFFHVVIPDFSKKKKIIKQITFTFMTNIINRDLSKDISKEPPKLIISERKALVAQSLNSSIDESYKDPREKNLMINIKKNTTTETKSIDLKPYLQFRVIDLKRLICKEELEEGKQIRLIYQGKQLNDEDKVENYKIKENTFLHVFISQPIQQTANENNITTISAELFEPERRGFDKFRPLDIMEEEIILFRAKFHSKYILLADKALINENELYKEEEEWLKINEEYLLDTEAVRETIKKYKEIEEPVQGSILNCILGFLVGIFLNLFFVAALIFIKERSSSFMKGFYIGLSSVIIGLYVVLYMRDL